ncbi:hypothetical protein GCM10009687_30450 [Asanoa iriomotensis]
MYVPYLVAIEQNDGEVRVHPAHFVTLTPDFVFVRGPAGRFENLPTRSVRSIRVTVQDLPADYDLLRADYPNAYQPWHLYDPGYVRRPSMTLAAKVRRLGRPPAHVIAKARELGYALADTADTPEHEPEPVPDSLAARRARRATSHDYLVFVKPGISDPYQILSRQRIGSHSLYRIDSWGFGATLSGLEIEALSEDPDIERFERDDDRLAPHFRTQPEDRVDGEYLVAVRRSGDPLTVAARAGVSPSHVFDTISTFSAALTDVQVQALRRDPDVVCIEDNAVVTLDD